MQPERTWRIPRSQRWCQCTHLTCENLRRVSMIPWKTSQKLSLAKCVNITNPWDPSCHASPQRLQKPWPPSPTQKKPFPSSYVDLTLPETKNILLPLAVISAVTMPIHRHAKLSKQTQKLFKGRPRADFLPKSSDTTIILESMCMWCLFFVNCLQTNTLRVLTQLRMIHTDRLFFTDIILIEKV